MSDQRNVAYRVLQVGNAEGFLRRLQFDLSRPRGTVARLRPIRSGGRAHQGMYDRESLLGLVAGAGFIDVEPVAEGRTRVADQGSRYLTEREVGSLSLEARRPWRGSRRRKRSCSGHLGRLPTTEKK